MSQQFRTVTTNAGRNAIRAALAQGKTVKLSHMSVGDGGGSPVTPLATMTALVNERFRAQINDITLDPATPDLFTSELFIPQAEGGWYIREVGLWMDDGTLFAVGNTPLTEKPDLSSGAATDLLVRLIIRVLDASTVSIEIDPAQVLATREYVDRKVDAHNKDGGAHETLARKNVQFKAGTGLSGGGTLEADRTLAVVYGNTASTACQGNDARLADTRIPKPHKATHQTGGTDALTPADIGAAAKTVQIKAGTGLSGGGSLEADRTLTITYGTVAGTACQGNDARLADTRTPKPHKATHQTGGTDALTPADIGAAAKTVQIKAGTGLSGGGSLEADRTLTITYGTVAGTACQGNDARLADTRIPKPHKATHQTGGTDALTPADIGAVPATVQVIAGTGLSGGGTLAANRTFTIKYGTAAGTACQGNDGRVAASEAFRLSMIGVPRYWRSTTLPEGHVWANGDLALFADWPELKKVYDGGGFNGMLLAYNADNSTIANNLGKWRLNAANPTGLYVPKLSEQFFRAWTGGGDGLAGIYNAPGLPEIGGHFAPRVLVQGGLTNAGVDPQHLSGAFHDGRPDTTETAPILATEGTYRVPAWNIKMLASRYNPIYSASGTVMPESVNLPVCLYLGLHT